MQDVLPRFEERREVVDELFDVDLGRPGHGTVRHPLVERGSVHGLIEVVRVLDVVEIVVEADIMDVPLLKFCFRQVCCRAAAQDVISHRGGPPSFIVAGLPPFASHCTSTASYKTTSLWEIALSFPGSTVLPDIEKGLSRWESPKYQPQPSRASMRFMASTVFS